MGTKSVTVLASAPDAGAKIVLPAIEGNALVNLS
jgi:hypothetical protein